MDVISSSRNLLPSSSTISRPSWCRRKTDLPRLSIPAVRGDDIKTMGLLSTIFASARLSSSAVNFWMIITLGLLTPPLNGTVEVDETYVGGRLRGRGTGKGAYLQNKGIVIGVIQRGGKARYRLIHSFGHPSPFPCLSYIHSR